MSTLRTAAQGAARYENSQNLSEAARRVGIELASENLARRSQRQITAPARAAARPRTGKPNTARPRTDSKTSIQPQAIRELSPKNAQSRVLAILDRLREGKNEKIYNMLYSIYRDAAATLFTRLELDDNALIASIEKQYEVVSNNIRQAGGSTNTLSLKFKTSDDIINFCLLMWLDMSHDGTLGADGMDFESFLQSSVPRTFLGEKVLKSFLGENLKLEKNTELMNRMLNKDIGVIQEGKYKGIGAKRKKFSGLWPGSQFEKKIKVYLPFIFGVQEPITTIAVSTKLSNSAINRDNKPIYVTIDSESDYKSISTLIENAKYPFTTSNGNRITRYYLKPIITLANRVDPGRLMPIKGVTEEFSKLMQKADKLKSTQLYNVKDCDFTVGETRLTLATAGSGKFNLKINGNEIPYGVTAGEAKKASNDKDKLSKFLGDFMQILTVLSKPVDKRMVLGTLDGVLCGMYCFLSKNLMEEEEEPRLFIDMSFKQRNQIVMYGVSDLIQIGKGVKQQESFIGSNFISNNNNSTEVSSGNNRNLTRSRVSVAGSNRGRLGGTPIRVVNENKNKNNRPPPTRGPTAQSGVGSGSSIVGNKNNNLTSSGNSQPNAKRAKSNESNNQRGVKRARNNNNRGVKRKTPSPRRGPNAQSGVGSRNSIVGNKNNNLTSSGNSQPNAKRAKSNASNNRRGVKRARNNNNNVSQPNAKRVNTNRNKLIQNLKKKNLSNAAINDYVKSYNNGTKSVNQIIQEVRANAKRKQNAKNAATLRTLRQLRPELFN